MREIIEVARGLKKADLVLKNGNLVNVFSGEVYPANVAIHKGRIAGLGDYSGKDSIDLKGKYICPGFIDSHLHLESSMLHPAEFAKAAIPKGTTAVITDPHEIANVLGMAGIRYMLEVTRNLPLDFFFMAPSCVPATELETSGARLEAKDLKPLLNSPRVLGLAEVMNYPGVLHADPKVLAKIKLFEGKVIDGHAPGVLGKDINAYVAAGPSTEHESIALEEAREKLRRGMLITIREGSSAKDLENLSELAKKPEIARFLTLCSDDIAPADLMEGHLDRLLQKAVSLGVSPVVAVQMATVNAARYYGLRGLGAVAPGYFADLAVVGDLKDFRVSLVFKRGELVAKDGKPLFAPRPHKKTAVRKTVKIKHFEVDELRIKQAGKYVKIIELVPNEIVTKNRVTKYTGIDLERDILKLVVVERHKGTGRIGIGFVKGFGLSRGAIAQTIAHDSHNIICVGKSDEDISSAIRRVVKLQGGVVLVVGGMILAELSLPIAGLMSDEPIEAVAGKMSILSETAKSLGCQLNDPFAMLSFLALPVIPELKLTDKGLVDVNQFKIVDLFE